MRPDYKKEIFFSNQERQKGIVSPVPADSPEILYQYYSDKIAYLQTQLNSLNLLEHPCEIQFVCGQITQIKRKSLVLARKYKMFTQQAFTTPAHKQPR